MVSCKLLLLTAATRVSDASEWSLSCRSTLTVHELTKDWDLKGHVYVTSGGDGNMAAQLNQALAARGATVVLGCRKPDKCQATREAILNATGVSADMVETETIDLSSRQSIKDFAGNVSAKHKKINALINSAGAGGDAGASMTKDGFNMLMEINAMGPAYLTDLLLPVLRGDGKSLPGRVVNVAADLVSTPFTDDTTLDDLNKAMLSTDSDLLDFGTSKLLLTAHGLELAKREKNMVSIPVNPNYALEGAGLPQDVFSWLLRSSLTSDPFWLKWFGMSDSDIGFVKRGHEACTTTMGRLDICPASYAGGAANIAAAAAAPGIEEFSGVWLDYETVPQPLPEDPTAHYLVEPTCVPRTPPYMNETLRSAWLDRVLDLMHNGTEAAIEV